MTTTYTLIAKQTVGSGGASSVTFSSIPNTFTDLKLVMSGRDDSSSNNWNLVKIQFNTDTTSGNYTYKLVGGFGSTAYSASGNQLASYLTSNARTANTFGNNEIYIPNYAGSTAKSFSSDSVTEGNGSSYEIMGLWAGLWSGTSAINQIVLSPDAGNFAEFSTFYLYGISNGSTQLAGAYATGGDVIVNDGTYWYHAFKYSGTFTPLKGLSCDYLVVAGGGGGADMIAGGGGAGGLRSTLTNTGGGASLESALSFAGNTSYTVTIGSGGIGAASNTNSSGTSGNNSSIIGGSISLVSIGGGYGSPSGINGGNGGSGGGTRGGGVAHNGGTGTSGQGYNGGNGTTNWGTGGGGAGQAGFSDGVGTTGAGGNGTYTALSDFLNIGQLSGGHYYLAAGGGGGGFGTTAYGSAGGTGGGGTGGSGNSSPGNIGGNGTANTGAGGGGGAYTGTGGNGGSGLVIVRYLI